MTSPVRKSSATYEIPLEDNKLQGEQTLYPFVQRILGLDFEKLAVYDDKEVLKEVNPNYIPATLFPSLPKTVCKGPQDYPWSILSLYCSAHYDHENAADASESTGEKFAQLFVIDPGTIEYYEGWWGALFMPFLDPVETDNLHGQQIQNMVGELLDKKKTDYKMFSGRILHLDLISPSPVSPQPVKRNTCRIL